MTFRGACRIALFSLGLAAGAAPVDNTLALGRKALLNDGVATAWKLAQQALLQAPDSVAAHEFNGEVLFRRGEFAHAETEFRAALRRDEKFALAWWGLARIAECSSLHKTADGYFRRAHELDPKDPRVFGDWAARLKGQLRIDALEQYASMVDPSRTLDELAELRQQIQLAQSVGERRVMTMTSPYQKTEIPLAAFVGETTHMRTYGLETDLNSTKLRLVLDTGASGILISRQAAEKARVSALSAATFRGFGDSAKISTGYRGIAQRLRIGPIEFHDALVGVSGQDFVGAEDGLIGTDVFADFLVTLDFAAQKMRLDPLPDYQPGDDQPHDRSIAAGMQSFTRVFRFGHLLLLPGRVNGSREGLFAIDSGSAKTLISSGFAAELGNVTRDSRAGITGLSGRVADVYKTGDLLLEFAGFRQKNLGITAFDMWDISRRFGTEISGFLGLPLLDLFTLSIDYRDGLVNFDRRER
ncbi:MAG TPA: aspartyl protease family protein [Bryobacteraceae bacterium]|nr:aspartyl protease family protein [Bryobacteraceae bacterium]